MHVAAYVEGYLEVLNDDKRTIFTATATATAASAAVDFILKFSRQEARETA